MSVRVLYQPGDEPKPGHKCELPNPDKITPDTVIECTQCGQRWVCRVLSRELPSAGVQWVRLRWWDFVLHRRVARAEQRDSRD